MTNKKLELSVKRSQFRRDDPHSGIADNEFKKIRPIILERESYHCQYCSFRAKKFQEIHHLNDDHSDQSDQNLCVICTLCHATQHLWLSGANKKGVIIYLDPTYYSIDQAGLNNLVRYAWAAEQSSNRGLAITASGILARLKKNEEQARLRIGSSDPCEFGDFLLNLPDDKYKNRSKYKQGYYFLPLREGFERQARYWSTILENRVQTKDWVKIASHKRSIWNELD